jgi:hypothetical protein
MLDASSLTETFTFSLQDLMEWQADANIAQIIHAKVQAFLQAKDLNYARPYTLKLTLSYDAKSRTTSTHVSVQPVRASIA